MTRHWTLGLLAHCLTVALSGCATIQETHYFERLRADSSEANYFRIRVSGFAFLSSARYLAGYYDERAIDLFFNEVKTGHLPSGKEESEPSTPARGSFRPLFPAEATLPGTDELVKPLNDQGTGTFLMLFSSNATTVADAIGQFAENQLAADALTNIVSRGDLRSLADRRQVAEAQLAGASALTAQLDALVDLLPTGGQPDPGQTERAMLRILNAVARPLGYSGSFATMDQSAGWFATLQR